MRRAARVDANQAEIVAALRRVGCHVVLMHAVGRGFPDLVVGRAGKTYLIEVKSEKGNLEETQKRFLGEWNGDPVHVVRTVDEALSAVEAI